MTIQPTSFSTFDKAVDHADGIAYGELMHSRKFDMVEAFTECHNSGRYFTNLYAIDRVLDADDYSVSYLVYSFE